MFLRKGISFSCFYVKEFHSVRQRETAFWCPTLNRHARDGTHSRFILRRIPPFSHTHKVDDIIREPDRWRDIKVKLCITDAVMEYNERAVHTSMPKLKRGCFV